MIHEPREASPEAEPEADYGEPPTSPEEKEQEAEVEVEPEPSVGNGPAGPMPDVAPHLRENAFEEWQSSLESFLRNLPGLPKTMFAIAGGNTPIVTLDTAVWSDLFRQLVTSEALRTGHNTRVRVAALSAGDDAEEATGDTPLLVSDPRITEETGSVDAPTAFNSCADTVIEAALEEADTQPVAPTRGQICTTKAPTEVCSCCRMCSLELGWFFLAVSLLPLGTCVGMSSRCVAAQMHGTS